jgi:DNA (cytosine-5)-methyltransferase 1
MIDGHMRQPLKSADRLTAISLYTGAGGLDLGFEAAGFETHVAVEMDDDCVATLRANRSWPVIHRSIHDVPSGELLQHAGLRPGEADVLIGGPPCQPFSKCGYWATGDAQRLEDPRASTVEAYLRVLRDARPRAYLMENVAGLAFRGKDEGIQLIREIVAAINREQGTAYGVELLVLNAADFGVPQMRERAFLIGARDGCRFGPLAPTHRPRNDVTQNGQMALALDLPPHLTAWDAIGDLEDDNDPALRVRGKWADLLPSIPEGSNYLHHTDRGAGLPLFGWRRRFWNFLLKLSKDQPSWTLTAQPGPATGPFHWRNRRLSSRELCRLQTIPDEYNVLGTIGAVQRQLGNAVPSALAEVIALHMRHRLLGEPEPTCLEVSPTLIPSRRGEPPPPEPPRPVADKYRHLIGEHAAHPGTGKGSRASLRSIAS